MEKTLFEHDGIPVYRYTGAPPRYALILLPGTGGYGGYYDVYCKLHVERGAEIWGMDPPGHGRSRQRRGKFTMEQYLDDVVRLAAHIRRETGLPVFTLGSSMGSGAAFYAMELSDDIVGGLGMGVCIGAAGWKSTMKALFNAPDAAALIDHLGDTLEFNIFRHLRLEETYASPEVVAKIKADPLTSERYDLPSYKSYLCYEPPTPTARNRKPFHFIVGGADPLTPPEMVATVYGNIGGPKTLTVIPDAPHQVMFFRSEIFLEAADGWIREQLAVPA